MEHTVFTKRDYGLLFNKLNDIKAEGKDTEQTLMGVTVFGRENDVGFYVSITRPKLHYEAIPKKGEGREDFWYTTTSLKQPTVNVTLLQNTNDTCYGQWSIEELKRLFAYTPYVCVYPMAYDDQTILVFHIPSLKQAFFSANTFTPNIMDKQSLLGDSTKEIIEAKKKSMFKPYVFNMENIYTVDLDAFVSMLENNNV